jgi:hypothetical protein
MSVFVHIVVVVRGWDMSQWSSVNAVLPRVKSQTLLVIGADGVVLLVHLPYTTMGIVLECGMHMGAIGHEAGSVPTKTALVGADAITHVHAYMLERGVVGHSSC